MQKITVSIKSLKEKLLEMEEDNLDLVELHIVPEQADDGSLYPAFLHLDGIYKTGEYKDYEEIDEFPVADYIRVHKSA